MILDADFTTLAAAGRAGQGEAPPRASGGVRQQEERGAGARTITSDELFDRHAEVRIAHRGGVYRLTQTSLGKLILTK